MSGGIDSAIIARLSKISNFYTVGLNNNNEFNDAEETAKSINKNLIKISLDKYELINLWKKLTKLRGEPLSLPNEGLIFKVCKSMKNNEKVVLTGEGADELLFGYDRINGLLMSII